MLRFLSRQLLLLDSEAHRLVKRYYNLSISVSPTGKNNFHFLSVGNIYRLSKINIYIYRKRYTQRHDAFRFQVIKF